MQPGLGTIWARIFSYILFTTEGVYEPRKGSPDNALGSNAQSPKENMDVVIRPGCMGTSEADEAAAAAAAAIGEVSK